MVLEVVGELTLAVVGVSAADVAAGMCLVVAAIGVSVLAAGSVEGWVVLQQNFELAMNNDSPGFQMHLQLVSKNCKLELLRKLSPTPARLEKIYLDQHAKILIYLCC